MADENQEFLKSLGFNTSVASPKVDFVSDYTMYKAQKEAEEEVVDLGFWDLVGKRQATQGTYMNIKGEFNRPDSAGATILTAQDVTNLTSGFSNRNAIERILEEASENGIERARYLANEFKKTEEANRLLGLAGIKGIAAQVVSDVFDPADIGVMIGSGAALSWAGPLGAGLGATTAKTSSLLSKFLKGKNYAALFGGVTAGETLALERLRQQSNYETTNEDLLLMTAISGTVGVGIGGFINQSAKRLAIQTARRKFVDEEDLTPDELNLIFNNSDEVLGPKYVQEALARDDFKTADNLTGTGVDARTFEQLSPEEQANVAIARGDFQKSRGVISSMANLSGKDTVAEARFLGSKLGTSFAGWLPNPDGTVNAAKGGALETRDWTQARFRGIPAAAVERAVKSFKKRVRKTEVIDNRENDLFEEAYDAFLGKKVSPEAQAIADAFRPNIEALGKEAVNKNVAGFFEDTLLDIKDYGLPRLRSQVKIRKLEDMLGADNPVFNELAEAAIRRGQPEIERKVAAKLSAKKGKAATKQEIDTFIKRLATGYMTKFRDFEGKLGMKLGNNDLDVDDFKEVLRQVGIPEDELDFIVELVSDKGAKIKGIGRAKPRMVLDVDTSIDVKIRNGPRKGEIMTVKFSDLVEKNVQNLYDTYVFQMSGAIALAERGIDTNDIASTFATQLNKVMKAGATEQNRRGLEYMYDMVKGTHIYRSDLSAGMLRTMNRAREISYSVSMGMAGMAALMELPMVMVPNSIEILKKTVPRYRQLLRDAENGEIKDSLGREMAAATGIGSDGLVSKFTRAQSRFEGEIFESRKTAGQFTKLDEVLGKSRVFVSMMSGLTGITDMLRRIASLNYAVSWETAARKGSLPYSEIKLEQLGITKDQATLINKQIVKHSTYLDKDKKILDAVNLDKWDDKELANIFALSARRDATTSVQEMNAGSVNKWLRSPIGMTAFQFLSFPLSSLEQQAVRMGVRAANGDSAEVARTMLVTTFMGSMMYYSRSWMNSIGRSDQADYMKERVKAGNWLVGTMNQVGPASLFSYLYQVATGTMDGSTRAITPASVSMGLGVSKGLKDLFASIGPDTELSEGQLRSMLRVLPFSSLYGARQILNSLASLKET